MNIKFLFLTVTLIISHLINTADLPQSKLLLEKIMREHFNRGATDQDLIEARDAKGYTVIHVLLEKIALAPHSPDFVNLFKTLKFIPKQVHQAFSKEDNTIPKFDHNALLKQYESNPEKYNLIKANIQLLGLITAYQRENTRLKLTALKISVAGGITLALGTAIGILSCKYFKL